MQKKDREREVVAELVQQLIAVRHRPRGFDITARNVPVAGLKITGEGESMQIEYSFSRKEIKTLQMMAEISGAPMQWHVRDAVICAQEYVNELHPEGNGTLFDLLDTRNGGWAPVPQSHRRRVRLFLQRMREHRSRWFDERRKAA